jgi:hypothetical protein
MLVPLDHKEPQAQTEQLVQRAQLVMLAQLVPLVLEETTELALIF